MTIIEQKIGGYSDRNIPGVLDLYAIDRTDVLSVLDPFRHRQPGALPSRLLAGDVMLKTGTVITKFKFPPLTCTFSSTVELYDGGNTYVMGVDFGIPGNREDILDYFNLNSQRQFMLLLVDANRKAYILGNEERGLKMTIAQSILTANSISANFSGKLNVPAFILETSAQGLVLADHWPDVEFGLEFSMELNA